MDETDETLDLTGAAVLVLHEGPLERARAAHECLRPTGLVVELHALSPEALESDRVALREIDPLLAALARRPGVDHERVGVLGFGRGGTLAFLVGCTRRVAAVVDVDGPLLHATLTSARPSQPLELALNFEGAFLGVFAAPRAEELELLRALLGAAARPHEIVLLPEMNPAELCARVRAFLRQHLAVAED